MNFKFVAKNNISRLPQGPGIYVFLARRSPKGEGGKKGAKFLYIGKAANLKDRVKNHFQQPAFKSNLFINQATKIGYLKTRSEIEALLLEAKLIKKYQPKYNVAWRDDKNYFYVGITKEDFPTVFITHQPKLESRIWNKEYRIKKHSKFNILNSKFFFVGPFVDGRALKQTLNTLRRVFPYRTCKPYAGRPCLWYQLGRCPGPCLLGSKLASQIPRLEETIKKESQKNAKNLKKILEARKTQVLKNLKKEMKKASKLRDFERAAKIRDQISALKRVLSHARLLEIIEPERENWKKTEKEIKKILGIKTGISRIEAYDVSNIQGKNAAGSMVTFINGQPDKNFYRKFKIRLTPKPNDVAMLKETLLRRFRHPEWGRPDLILIDGGAAQLSAAVNSKAQIPRLRPAGFGGQAKSKNIKIIALAKRQNELYIEGQKQPVLLKKLPREVFNLILRLRDEAHRFAIAYYRKLTLANL